MFSRYLFSIILVLLCLVLGLATSLGIDKNCADTCSCFNTTLKPPVEIGRNYRPVVLIHGILRTSSSLDFLKSQIQMKHPGTEVFNLNCYGISDSVNVPLWNQVEKMAKEVRAISDAYPNGIHLVGYSQGGVIARGILQMLQKHNIHHFISLSAPQAGQYGCFNDKNSWMNIICRGIVNLSGDFIPIDGAADLIHDSKFEENYRKKNKFLPVFNNEVDTLQSLKFKRGIIQLRRMVLIGGPDDEVITPWQSSLFGFYDESFIVRNLRERDAYLNDAIGLKTLDRAKRLITHEVPNVCHLSWISNTDVIDRYILPHLH